MNINSDLQKLRAVRLIEEIVMQIRWKDLQKKKTVVVRRRRQ